MAFFKYGERELGHLRRCDRRLGAAIDRIGMIEREVNPDFFPALVESMISQQISGKAALTVCRRFAELAGVVTPERVASLSTEEIQACGMSFRKAENLRGAALALLEKRVDPERFPEMEDQAVIRELCTLNGVGVWTAEMLLLFSLCRPDVVSQGDFGIRRGMMKLYGVTELSSDDFRRYRRRYSPYGSVASFYLWEVGSE